MVLVILIALWAVVLVPPYLKDRRASSRTFRATQSGSLPVMSSAQRFQPLQHAAPAVRASMPPAFAGPAVTPVGRSGTKPVTSGSNVVPLHPLADEPAAMFSPLGDESTLQQAWETPSQVRAGIPSSTAAARERRRHVLIGLSAVAFVTLLAAMVMGGNWVALHIAVDAALVGYVILLVRFRQIASERRDKVQPIRPAVTEHSPATLQAAPSYLVRSGT